MKEQILLSIIIPVYNVAKYLPNCIDSILSCDTSECELVLVDDGSTEEESILVCNDYAAKHPDFIRCIHQANGGLGFARNTGIANARGEYLLFIDGDDYVKPETLTVLKEKLKEESPDMLIFGFEYHRGTKVFAQEERRVQSSESCFALHDKPMLILDNPSACTRVWKKSVFDSETMFKPIVWFEDLRTTAKSLLKIEKIYSISDPLYCYLLREGSITHSSNYERNIEIIDALKDIRDYYEKKDTEKEFYEYEVILAVQSVLEAARRVLIYDANSSCLPRFIEFLQTEYSDYNKFISKQNIGTKKYIYLKLLEKKQYRLAKFIFDIKKIWH